MRSDYGYELTDRAEKDIDEIAGYIRDELSNASAAMNFLNDVEQCIRDSAVRTVCRVHLKQLMFRLHS